MEEKKTQVPSGTPESLSSLTVRDVKEQYERIICASNAVICISGDVRKEEVLPLLEKHLGGMRAGTPPALTPTPALRAGREVAVLDKQQAVLKVARVFGNGVCAVADLVQ